MGTIYRTSKPAAYPRHQLQPRRTVSTTNRHKTSLRSYLLAATAISALILPVFALVAFLFAFNALDIVLPGVRTGGANIGGLNGDRAVLVVDNAWNYDRKLLVTDGSHAWTAAPLDFGLWVDPGLTAANALELGRGQDAGPEFGQMLRGEALNLPPVVDFRPELARAQLKRWSPLVEQAPQDAVIAYQNGRWTAVPGIAGTQLDVESTVALIQANPSAVLTGGILQLVVRPVQPQISDLSQELSRMQALMDRPLQIAAYDPINDDTVRWDTTPQEMAAWMRVGERSGAPSIQVDVQAFNQYLAGQQGRIGAGRAFVPLQSSIELEDALADDRKLDLDIERLPEEYVVQPGDTLVSIGFDLGIPYWHIQEANPGLTASSLAAGDTITIPSQNVMLPLPVVKNKRVVISISQQRLWEYENGQLRRDEVISTGIDRSPTYAGVFQVQSHELNAYASVWDLYMPHFLGIYEATPGFMNGLHGLPTLSSGYRMWADALGRKASYGCIILTLDAAEDLYAWAEDGVVVEIQR